MNFQRVMFVLISLSCYERIWAVDYEVIGDHDRFIEPCSEDDELGNTPISDFLDMDSLKRIYTDDLDFVYLTGDVVVKKSFPPNHPIKVATEILYWSGNRWVNTIFSIRRDNLCDDLFNPTEFWYEFMNNLSEEQRVCPPQAGTIYKIENVPSRIPISLPNASMPNQLKILIHLSVANLTFCVTVFAHIYKL